MGAKRDEVAAALEGRARALRIALHDHPGIPVVERELVVVLGDEQGPPEVVGLVGVEGVDLGGEPALDLCRPRGDAVGASAVGAQKPECAQALRARSRRRRPGRHSITARPARDRARAHASSAPPAAVAPPPRRRPRAIHVTSAAGAPAQRGEHSVRVPRRMASAIRAIPSPNRCTRSNTMIPSPNVTPAGASEAATGSPDRRFQLAPHRRAHEQPVGGGTDDVPQDGVRPRSP